MARANTQQASGHHTNPEASGDHGARTLIRGSRHLWQNRHSRQMG